MSQENDEDDDSSIVRPSAREIRTSAVTFILVISTSISALTLGSIQNFSCKTITFPQNDNSTMGSPGSIDSGPFMYRFTDVVNLFVDDTNTTMIWQVCRSYSHIDDDLDVVEYVSIHTTTNHTLADEARNDPSIIGVQAMAVAACILGSIMILSVCCVPYCGLMCSIQWRCYGLLFMITSLVQGLSLVILDTTLCLDNPIFQLVDQLSQNGLANEMFDSFVKECEMSVGYYCGIASTILWFLTALLICCKQAPGKYEEDCLTQYLQLQSEEVTAHRLEMLEKQRKRAAATGTATSSIPVYSEQSNNVNNKKPSIGIEARYEGADKSDDEDHLFHSTRPSPGIIEARYEGVDETENDDHMFHSTKQFNGSSVR